MIPTQLITERSAFETVPYPCTIHVPVAPALWPPAQGL